MGKALAESRCSRALPAWLDSLQSSMLAAACSQGIHAVCLHQAFTVLTAAPDSSSVRGCVDEYVSSKPWCFKCIQPCTLPRHKAVKFLSWSGSSWHTNQGRRWDEVGQALGPSMRAYVPAACIEAYLIMACEEASALIMAMIRADCRQIPRGVLSPRDARMGWAAVGTASGVRGSCMVRR